MMQRSPHQFFVVLRRKSLARTTHLHMLRLNDRAFFKCSGSDQTFSKIFAVNHFALGNAAFTTITHSLFNFAHAFKQTFKFGMFKAGGVVRSFRCAIEGKVTLNHTRPQAHGCQRYGDATLVARVANQRVNFA